MRVQTRPAAAQAGAAWDGWAVRRDWEPGAHELVGYRLSQDQALEYALVDARLWASMPAQVRHSVVRVGVVAYERHAGLLCTSPQCPTGTVVSAQAWAKAGVRA